MVLDRNRASRSRPPTLFLLGEAFSCSVDVDGNADQIASPAAGITGRPA